MNLWLDRMEIRSGCVFSQAEQSYLMNSQNNNPEIVMHKISLLPPFSARYSNIKIRLHAVHLPFHFSSAFISLFMD
jgi:hypothetical protein